MARGRGALDVLDELKIGLLSGNLDASTVNRLRDAAAFQIELYEPRILLDQVEVEAVDGDPAALRLEIAYRLRRDGRADALALALRLGG